MFNILLCSHSAFLVSLDVFKSHEEQLYSWQSKESMSAENWNVELLEKVTEKSSLVELIDYFIILKSLMILFLLFVCINYVPNYNGKIQEETLADSNSEVVKTILRDFAISKWPSLFFKFFKYLSPFLCHFVTYNKEY